MSSVLSLNKKKAAMENNSSYIFQREKEVAILKKKLSRD